MEVGPNNYTINGCSVVQPYNSMMALYLDPRPWGNSATHGSSCGTTAQFPQCPLSASEEGGIRGQAHEPRLQALLENAPTLRTKWPLKGIMAI